MEPTSSPGTRRGPSRAWYLIGGVVIAAGVISGIALFVDAVTDDEFAVVPIHGRIEVPGEGEVDVPEPGGYTLYWEPAFPPPDADEIVIPPLELFVQDAETGDPLPTADYDGTFSYTQSGRKGIAVRTFRSDGDDVLVTAVGPPGISGAVAVGEGFDVSDLVQIGVGAGIGFLGVSLGGVVVGITAWRRHRARYPKLVTTGRPATPPPPPPHP